MSLQQEKSAFLLLRAVFGAIGTCILVFLSKSLLEYLAGTFPPVQPNISSLAIKMAYLIIELRLLYLLCILGSSASFGQKAIYANMAKIYFGLVMSALLAGLFYWRYPTSISSIMLGDAMRLIVQFPVLWAGVSYAGTKPRVQAIGNSVGS